MARHDFTDADRSEIHARYHRGKARLEEAKGVNNASLTNDVQRVHTYY